MPGAFHSRSALVSFSQNSGVGAPLPASVMRPSSASSATSRPAWSLICGRATAGSHDQRLRNHNVGSMCNVAASGPALRTWTRTQRSSGAAFA